MLSLKSLHQGRTRFSQNRDNHLCLSNNCHWQFSSKPYQILWHQHTQDFHRDPKNSRKYDQSTNCFCLCRYLDLSQLSNYQTHSKQLIDSLTKTRYRYRRFESPQIDQQGLMQNQLGFNLLTHLFYPQKLRSPPILINQI